jgi:hypothetical protein
MPETAEVHSVNAPIHEAEAVSWTDDSIASSFENGTKTNFNKVQIPAEPLPGNRQ